MINTSNIVTVKGKAPEKISYREILGSLMVLLMTKHEIPSGGVRRPISASTTVTIPFFSSEEAQPLAMLVITRFDQFGGGVFNFVELFSRALHNKDYWGLTKKQRKALIGKFEHNFTDHIPIWIRLPKP